MSTADSGKKEDPRWERVQDLFSRAIDLPQGERSAFVARECAGDPSLHKELIDLLLADAGQAGGDVLGNALGAAINATSRDRRKALVGRVLGNYRLTSVLGHGGTGTVYLAERADRQYSAQVAIKIVDSATIHGDLGLRFRAERQILASLNHPNIARLIDAGETPEGQPYLAMEYVHGEPLDRFCDQRQLDLPARLRLFLEICNAVQYAHQNLVVHRDLKPANILVTADGAPKLLDFGIAKLLDAGDAATVLALTRLNDRLLTPEYASPEQILGRAVTTASDVYALGVVLYELLAGLRPYSVPASASQLELERSICITDPLRPSSAVRRALDIGAGGETADMGAVAAARRLSVDRLQRKLLGDIDAIVMRALRKEPERRYASVEQLASDIRRYLTREPVLARQGNWLYYSTRFARRNAFGVAAGATFVAMIMSFGVAMSIQSQRVAAERDRAEQEGEVAERVSEFMLNTFAAAEPFTSHGAEITARELLERAGANVRQDLSQTPEVRARLLESIGRTYRRLGDTIRSLSYLEDAVRIRRQTPETDPLAVAGAMNELSITLRQTGDHDHARRVLHEAVALCDQTGRRRTGTYANLLTNLGRLELDSGNLTAARRYLQTAVALGTEVLGPHNPETAVALLDLARVFQWNDDLRSAEEAIRRAVSMFADTPPSHPDRILADTRLGEVLLLQDRPNEAEPVFQRALAPQMQLFGRDSRQVADVLDSLASIKRKQGLLKEAEDLSKQALEAHSAAMGEDHYYTAFYRTQLSAILIDNGKYDEAASQLRLALETQAKTLPADHPYVASAEYLLGEALLHTNHLADAEATLVASMNRWRRSGGPKWRSARSASALGEALYRQGRSAEAERYLADSYRDLAVDDSADRAARIKARERVVRFYSDRGEKKKLADLMLGASEDDALANAPDD